MKSNNVLDKRTLEVILTDQKEEIEARSEEQLCYRKEVELIDINSPQAQVVIGVRRSGKSTLCYQALKKAEVDFAYADFDDERLVNMTSDQLNDLLEVLYKIYGEIKYLFFDEIQNIEGWHLFVNRLLRKKIHILITGSNAKLLSSELATHLSGRNKEIHLFPFSFSEYCEMMKVDTKTLSTKAEGFRRNAFDQYMVKGGFPEMLSMKNSGTYIRDLVNNIVNRDINQRFNVAYKVTLEKLANHLLNVVPTIVVPNDLSTTFQIKSIHTISNYINFLEQAFLLVVLQKYSTKSKLRITQNKVYPIDVAMMNQRENAFVGENLGWRLESIVFIELLRQSKIKGYDIYYLNERSGECDFVVCNGNKVIQAIQVSYDITSEKTRRRELNGLVIAAKKTGCEDLLLLTDHTFEEVTYNEYHIKIMPVYNWCLL